MDPSDWQAEQFEHNRTYLRAVAQRMLGSAGEADDAVQEAWMRLNRVGSGEVDNLRAWLTTVVSRICLDMLRARQARREQLVDGWLPEPVVTVDPEDDPEREAMLADSVGLAMLVVLEALTPAERLAFVLHDMFGVPFEEIAPIVDRTPAAARQLASRARRTVRGAPGPEPASLDRQRTVVEAFIAAAREGDFDALLEVLAPEIEFRSSGGALGLPEPIHLKGREQVVEQALTQGRGFVRHARPAIVNGTPGMVIVIGGRVVGVAACTIEGDRVAAIDLIVDPEKLARVRV